MIKDIVKKIKRRKYYKKRITIKDQKAPDSYFADISSFDPFSEYEGGNNICSGVTFDGKIGYGSYIGPNSTLSKTSIGRYCSIAQSVQLAAGRHPSSQFVSTHPAFFSTLKQSGFSYVNEQKFEEYKYADEEKKYLLIIGNDVWIGANVLLLEGITIGDGAIVGAGSVVTKDVPPFSIVAGSPARVIRYRFTEDEIAFLNEFQWWNKDTEWIKNHAELFQDISNFKLLEEKNN